MATRSETSQAADPAVAAEHARQVLHLLELLAADAPVAEVAAATAPTEARDLALRIASAREVHQHREAGLAALLDTARELATESDPGSVLDAIVRRARRLVGTDLAYLTLYDPEAGDTYMRATDGSVSAAFQSVRLALGAGLGGLVASTRKPYWTADYWSDERFQHTEAINSATRNDGSSSRSPSSPRGRARTSTADVAATPTYACQPGSSVKTWTNRPTPVTENNESWWTRVARRPSVPAR